MSSHAIHAQSRRRPLREGLLALALLTAPACVTAPPASYDQADTRSALLAVLSAQNDAWNNGDLDGYMAGYVRGEALRFASGGTVQRGWQGTYDRYQARYGTSNDSMGRLSFSELETEQVGPDTAIAHGRWHLERNGKTMGGLFTLVFRRIDGEWLIVSDTTTLAD